MQNAFIFSPYKKLAKLSLNLDRLSCMICISPISASSVAIASESSAKAGSRTFRGNESSAEGLPCWEPREDRRRGVAGRELGRELEDFTFLPVEIENWTGVVVEGDAIGRSRCCGGEWRVGDCLLSQVHVGKTETQAPGSRGVCSFAAIPAATLRIQSPRASGLFTMYRLALSRTETPLHSTANTPCCAPPTHIGSGQFHSPPASAREVTQIRAYYHPAGE